MCRVVDSFEQKMANRMVFETMLAELYPLPDSHDVEESSENGSYDH